MNARTGQYRDERMPQSVEVGNLTIRVLRLEELTCRSPVVFGGDLLDFGQPDRARLRPNISAAFLNHVPGHSVSTGCLIFGAADDSRRVVNHVASISATNG
ncbi:MAG: hypothetical protein NTZ32_06135 [Planctomycetales bacterium]|nr:hypothetical protein [Planctomycetales bacterium]